MSNPFYGGDKPTFIIAELSANHNGSLDNAIATIKAAKQAGANAIKLQTYTADTMTLDCKKPDFKLNQGTIWDGKYFHDLYQEAYTPWEWHPVLFEVARAHGLICFSSPFDHKAVDFLETLDCPIYKIASFEITDIPLISYVASKQKPVIISTGIADYEDIRLAVETCRAAGNQDITLLKCTSSYPAPIEEANLSLIPRLASDFQVCTGLSDHTMELTAPVVSVALGGKVIEKHFIIDRSIGGPDSSFSLNASEFASMVQAVRETEKAMGIASYELTPKQLSGKAFARSLYVSEDMQQGEVFTEKNIRCVRPGFGLHPKHLTAVLGRKSLVSIEKGTRLSFDLINFDATTND